MKRLSALLLAAAVLAGAPGFPAAQAFAQAAAAASAGARVSVPVLGPAAAGANAGVQPAQPGLIAGPSVLPALLPAVVVPLGSVTGPAGSVSAGGVAAGKTAPGPAITMALAPAAPLAEARAAAGLARASPGQDASPVRAHGERGPPAERDRGAAPAIEPLGRGDAPGRGGAPRGGDDPLDLRASQEARFDGALARPRGEDATQTGRGGWWPRAAGLARAERGRAALPTGDPSRLPPAPGAETQIPAPPQAARGAGSFRVPFALSAPTRLLMVAHGLGLMISAAALAAGLGWAALASSAIVGAGVSWRWSRLPALEDEPLVLSPEQREVLTRRVELILDGHLAALGLDPSRRPRIEINNNKGPEAAVAVGRGIRPESVVRVGEGLLFRPVEHVSGMLAHELGHLALEHDSPVSRLRSGGVMSLGLGLYAYAAVWGAAVRAAAWAWQLAHDLAWSAFAGDALTSLAWVLAGYAVLYASMLAGVSTYRREELMADRFAAFVGAREHWTASLAHSLAVRGELAGGWWRRLHAMHPTYAERLRRL